MRGETKVNWRPVAELMAAVLGGECGSFLRTAKISNFTCKSKTQRAVSPELMQFVLDGLLVAVTR